MKSLFLRTAALCLAGVLHAAPAAAQALDHFLNIAGVGGDSVDARHRRWIDVAGWSWGVHQALDANGKPAAAFDPFSWQQGVDSSVVPLFLGVAGGSRFESATLDVQRSGGETAQVFFQMVFDGVQPTSLVIANGSDVAAASTYDAVTMRYHDGKGWIEGRFALGPQGVGFTGDANVLRGLLLAGGDVSLDIGALPPVPEPATGALMAMGLMATALRLRRRRTGGATPVPR